MPTSLPGSALQDAALSSALSTIFRGKLCDTLFLNRAPVTFAKGSVIYDPGDSRRTFFFVRRGVVKIGALIDEGREVIYDVRKEGDVVGELCALDMSRRDYAVALEPTDVIVVPYADILDVLQRNRVALQEVMDLVCRSLAAAYDQVNLLSSGGTVDRLVKLLLRLARQLGRAAGDKVQVDTYLTQEELSQMIASSREKVSVAMNLLRARGLVQYSRRGHLLLDQSALENWSA